jgi:hypothetical protein
MCTQNKIHQHNTAQHLRHRLRDFRHVLLQFLQLCAGHAQLVAVRGRHLQPDALRHDVHLLEDVLGLLGQRQVEVQLVDLCRKSASGGGQHMRTGRKTQSLECQQMWQYDMDRDTSTSHEYTQQLYVKDTNKELAYLAQSAVADDVLDNRMYPVDTAGRGA